VGQPTGIDLPGESAGYLGIPASVQDTPLLDAVWSAGAATGAVVTPRLGLAFGSSPTRFSLPSRPSPRRLPFAVQLGPVRAGMRSVVTSGTALILQSLPVPAGGKTGTAETSPGRAKDSTPGSARWRRSTPETMKNPTVEGNAFIRLPPAPEGDSGQPAGDPTLTASRRLSHVPVERVENLFVAQACGGALGHTGQRSLRKPDRERERVLEQLVESAE
jgi:hypothetical protein